MTARQRLLAHEPSLPPPELATATVIGSAPDDLDTTRTQPERRVITRAFREGL